MFDFLFRRRARPADPAAEGSREESSTRSRAGEGASAPGTAIRYSADLIGKLKGEHARLLAIFARIQQAFEQGDLALVSRALAEFRVAIQGHLLAENVRLYIYLEHQLAGDGAGSELIRSFRHEMDGIGKAVMSFLNKYRNIAAEPTLAESFGSDLAAVGEILARRIEREETTLYPLYEPNY